MFISLAQAGQENANGNGTIDEKYKVSLFTGGKWECQYPPEEGCHFGYYKAVTQVEEHVLELPLMSLTYSELMDHVCSELGLSKYDKVIKLTYPYRMYLSYRRTKIQDYATRYL